MQIIDILLHTMMIELFDLLSSIAIMAGILQCKLKKTFLPYLLSMASFLIILCITVITNNLENLPPICLVLEMFIVVLCFNEKIAKKLVFYLAAYISGYILNSGIILLFTFIYGIRASDVWLNNGWRIVVMIINISIIILVSKTIQKRAKSYINWIKNISLRQLAVGITGLFGCTVLLGFMQFQSEDAFNHSWNKAAVISVTIVSIFFMTGILLLMYVNDSRKLLLKQNLLNEKYIVMQQMHYREIIENDHEIRRLIHDMKAHLNCIQTLTKEENYLELQNYVTNLDIEVEGLINKNIKSGNDILDALINYMDKEDAKVQFIMEGKFPNDIKVAAIDLCTIFSNIISNAVEACIVIDDEEERIIKITIKKNNSSLYIITENPTLAKIDTTTLGKITTKLDKKNHGFGIQNIVNTVQKYKGEVEFKSFEDKFCVEILLPNIIH